MHMRHRLRLSIAAAGAALAAAAAALEPQQFVAGWPIEVPAGAEVFDVPLTAEVYAAAGSVEHIAVLDANGEPQPFFRRSFTADPPGERRLVIEASPLYASSLQQGLIVGVTTNERSTAVNVATDAPTAPTVTGFVVDARAADVAPIALELEWRALPQPFLLDVAVEQSMDLTSWRSVGRASVAALSVGGAEVRHTRVPVRASAGGYLRVTPHGSVPDWHLLRATLVSATSERPPRLTLALLPLAAGVAGDDEISGALYFDAGGALPVVSAALRFGANDDWVRADVAASGSLEGPWIPVAHGELQYTLAFEGREFASEPIAVGRREARYWRVVPSSPPRGEQLELELAFPQEHLRVAAGGEAPHLLAAGTIAEEAGPDATLAQVWTRLEPPADTVALATLGQRSELGGLNALVAEWRFPWRAALLWAVLIGGVLVVAAMAVRLAQEMRSQSS